MSELFASDNRLHLQEPPLACSGGLRPSGMCLEATQIENIPNPRRS